MVGKRVGGTTGGRESQRCPGARCDVVHSVGAGGVGSHLTHRAALEEENLCVDRDG